VIETARKLVSKGVSVIPLWPKAKNPAISEWAEYQTRRPTDEELVQWFRDSDRNLGIVTGAISGLVVVDEDWDKGGKDTAEKMGVSSPVQVLTGRDGGGRHNYFKHPGGTVQNRVSLGPGLDVRGDGGYVVAPPSVHESGRRYTWHGRGEMPVFNPPQGQTATGRHTNPPGWMAEVLAEMGPGNRHAALCKIAGKLIRDKHDDKTIVLMLGPHLERMATEGAGENPFLHFQKILTDIRAKESGKDVAEVVSLGGLLKEQSTTAWAVQDRIPAVGITFLIGSPGEGKTWLTLDLAAAFAGGGPWLGRLPVEKKRVVYFDDESAKALLSDRLKMICAGRDVDHDLAQFWIKPGFDINRPEDLGAMKRRVLDHRAEVVFLDSFSCFHGGDDNSSDHIRRAMERIKTFVKETNTALVIVDHLSTRAIFDKATPNVHDVAGNKMKIRQADSVLGLYNASGKKVLYHTKSRYGRECEPLELLVPGLNNSARRPLVVEQEDVL
jgi:hypothetical protein